MELKNFFAQDLQGNVIPSPTVYLYQPGTTTLATGLQNAAGAALSNPFNGTANGQVTVAAPDGEYDMRVTGAGRDTTMRVRFISVSEDAVAAAEAAAQTATAQAQTATTQAGLATTNGAAQVALAAQQATLAASAKTAAEAARDAATVNANVYADTTAGLAATTNGQQFQIVAGDEIIRYRRDSATVAVEVARYPSAEGVFEKILTGSSPSNAVEFVDEKGRIAAAIESSGAVKFSEVKADKYTFTSSQLTELAVSLAPILSPQLVATTAQELGALWPTDVALTNVYAVGDSTVAAYIGTGVLTLMSSARIKNSLAVPGHTIAQQKAIWESTTVSKALAGYVIVQVGLNDVNPTVPASTVAQRLQDLISTIRADVGYAKPILISQMIPCRQRWINIYGPTIGLTAQQIWTDINVAIAGQGPTPVTGVDGRITEHVALMADASSNLKAEFDTGDGIHPNNAGRTINATAWFNALRQIGLVA